ncbi:MAG: hypothetical protein U0573_01950 [Phycisphaerales bacterium]|nr:hypothetical protein [Planctomycetota bacterium]
MPDDTRNPGDDGAPPEVEPARPPATEEADWRARALAAEAALAQTQSQLEDARSQLDRSRAELEKEKTSRRLDRALAGSGAIDPEVVALLLEPRLSQDSPDIDALLRELRAAKPFLFEPALPARPAPSVMSPEPVPRDQLADLALEARASGSRLSLLNYLRARAARA